jgi:uncharacterized low-complexity protein
VNFPETPHDYFSNHAGLLPPKTYYWRIFTMAQKSMITKPVAAAVGVAFVSSLAASATVMAADNPFEATDLDNGYMLAGGEKAEEGKCGEGKCGGEKDAEGKCGGEKAEEGKCGEGKCGGEKAEEGKCGGEKAEEGKCGGEKAEEGKCGGEKAEEGKCGGDKH